MLQERLHMYNHNAEAPWEEDTIPGENPHQHQKDMETPHRNTQGFEQATFLIITQQHNNNDN